MNRIILCLAVALAATTAPTRVAVAQDAPTKDQLDQAKKAYGEGKALYEAKKYAEAVDKFKESYRLSKNALLLYNIGLAYDDAGQKDNALLYYRKFLTDAPQTAAQRSTAQGRVDALEKEKLDADLNGPGNSTGNTGNTGNTTTQQKPPETPVTVKPGKIKPAGTYSASDFQHQLVDSAPPGKPLDVTAFVPEDSGFVVTLYFRGKGESQFVAKPMTWRYKELVARIPAKKMVGNAIQYYLEVKDQAGTVVTRSGKPTDPNLITIEAGAAPHFYMDMNDEGAAVPVAEGTGSGHHDEEDPLKQKRTAQVETNPNPEENPETPPATGGGFTDVGSEKFKYAKYGSSIAAVAFLGMGVTFYILAGKQADYLVNDTHFGCGTTQPPCHAYDTTYDKAWEDAGKRDATLANVGIVLGVASAGVAGYFWYKEFTAKKPPADSNAAPKAPEMTWLVVPALGDGFAGATAAARF